MRDVARVKIRAEEVWAAACLRVARPDLDVRQYDDGSRSSMPDLALFRRERLVGMCEVTSASDGAAMASWKRLNDNDEVLMVPGLKQGWLVEVAPERKEQRLLEELPTLLRLIEGYDERVQQYVTREFGPPSDSHLAELGVVSLLPVPSAPPGRVHVTLYPGSDRHGGAVPKTGDGLAVWLSEWLAAPAQHDNIQKLAQVDVAERQIFVLFPGFSRAPFSVVGILCRDNPPLPTVDLQVPDVIDQVWAASTWSIGEVFGWRRGEGWRSYPKPAGQMMPDG